MTDPAIRLENRVGRFATVEFVSCLIVIEKHVEIDPEQIREVYALFGMAMYQAQCLERQLAIILATKYGPGPANVTREELDDILARLFSKSLGQLVSDVTKLSALSRDEEQQLRTALKTRNWLTHGYFWDRAADLVSVSGRASMIEELRGIAKQFERLDDFFTGRTVDWAESVGVSQEMLNEQLERLLKHQAAF